MNKFSIKNIGTGLGDCFIIEIVSREEQCVILVDGHREKQSQESFTFIKENIKSYDKIDYLIITHIDDDHIGGILKLLELPANDEVALKMKNAIIVYNNVTSPIVNYEQARRLEKILIGRKVINTCKKDYINYNDGFLKILSCDKREKFDPEEFENYKGHPVMTFIHPNNVGDVEKVRSDYNRKLNTDGSFRKPNSTLVNQYSIVFLIEFMKKRVLFTGDASITDLSEKVMRLKNIIDSGDDGAHMNPIKKMNKKIDMIKLPHHGADENNKGLIELVRKSACNLFFVTGEKNWNERHPAKSVLNDLYNELSNKLRIYTKIDMTKYINHDEVIRNDDEINILETE